jgi:DNA-binding transcriptional LysR family regulator
MPSEVVRYLPTFLLVAEELSFSATARRLGLTPAAVSKSMRTLEGALGVRLFHRSTHALTLTDDGERLRRRSAPLFDALDESLAKLTSVPETPRGLLRVAAPYSVGKDRLIPILAEFRARYPEIDLDLYLDDRVIDLVKERIDVSIGVRMDPKPGLIGKKLFDTKTAVVASPRFLETHGVPQRPGDVERFPCIRYRTLATGRLFPWTFTDPKTRSTIALNPAASITATSLEIVAELAAAHHGLALTGLTSVQPYLRAGTLVQVLSKYAYYLPPMMLYYTSKHDLPSRVRVFIDFVAQRLRDPERGD